jgi:hypothetical protein
MKDQRPSEINNVYDIKDMNVAFKYPSSRVQTQPKPSGFFRVKKPSARLPSEGK